MPPTSQPSPIEVDITLSIINAILAAAMLLLTLAIVWLTWKVKQYAGQTLRATQESLDFFAKPLVAFRGPTHIETSHLKQDSTGTVINVNQLLLNESAKDIRIEKVSSRILTEKSSEWAKNLNLRGQYHKSDNGLGTHGLPIFVSRALEVHATCAKGENLTLPDENIEVVVEIEVQYVYRDRDYVESQEFHYILKPIPNYLKPGGN